MKATYFIGGLISIAWSLQACDKDDIRHPGNSTVEQAFTTQYPGASRIDWERKGTYFVVDFHRDGKESEAWYDTNGTWYMTETDLVFDALPIAIKEAFLSGDYKAWRIDDIDKVERKEKENFYVLEVESGNMEYDLYYLPSGTLAKTGVDINDRNDNEHYLTF